MANLDPKFVIAPSLQMYFVDKDTGLPLTGGLVYFYENGTNIPKPVYEIAGLDGNNNIIYTPLSNPVTLSAVGTFQDDTNNDILPYYYPYDDNNNIQLYSIEVYDSSGVLQFTRDNWPNYSSANISAAQDLTNFVPNGQFLLHNDVPASSANGYVAGKISSNDTNIAPGGWYFVRDNASTADDRVTFTAIGQGADPSPPGGNPPYAVRIHRVTQSNDTRTDLVIRYPDVNMFGSTYFYNLYFNGESRSANAETVEVFVYQNFGSGSTTTRVPVSQGVQVIDTSYNTNGYNTQLSFANNTGADIQPGNYVEIIIRLPLNTTFDLEFTDFCIILGNSALNDFPPQTSFQQMAPSTAGSLPTPAYDGSDLYLPIKMGKNGFIVDNSEVGSVYGKFATAASATTNELLMDGSTYVYANYSSLGIPYSRLADFLIANSPAITIGTSTIPAQTIPLFGTGANFVTILKNTDPTKFDLSFNTASGSNVASNGTTSFTHTSADPLYVYTVVSVPTAGMYFSFTPHTGGDLVYNVYFTVDGIGTSPATPSGANILVALITGDTVASTITKIVTAVNQYQFMLIDARGYFWRGLDSGTSIDPDSATRTIPGITDNSVAAQGAYLGSKETEQIQTHTHTPHFSMVNGTNGTFANTGWASSNSSGAQTLTPADFTISIDNYVGSETRPINLALNWFIRY